MQHPLELVLLSILISTVYYTVCTQETDSDTKGILSLLLQSKLPTADKCPPGEVYNRCGHRCSEHCHIHECENYHRHDPCIEGCFCQEPLVRVYGKCQSREACRRSCPGNLKWRKSNKCLDKCNFDRHTCPVKQSMGCFCETGYAFIENDCYRNEFCNCKGNQTFSSCGRSSDEGCDGQIVLPESDSCRLGCFCYPGYKRVNTTTCMLPADTCMMAAA